jgi:hypothetical protein
MDLRTLTNRLGKLEPQPRPPTWKPKPTSSESRQALDRLLAEIESKTKPSGPPPVLSREEQARSDAARAEIEGMLAKIEKDIADSAKWWATPWNERGKP